MRVGDGNGRELKLCTLEFRIGCGQFKSRPLEASRATAWIKASVAYLSTSCLSGVPLSTLEPNRAAKPRE